MATIGTFTQDGESFTGTINTLVLKAKATLQPVEKTNDQMPDFRVYANGTEIGAGWQKPGKGDRPYLSVKLDDPSFPQPIYCRLIELESGRHQLLWSR